MLTGPPLTNPLPSLQIIKYPSERRDVDTLAMWVKTVAGTN